MLDVRFASYVNENTMADENIEVGFEADYAPDLEFGLDPAQVDVTLEEIVAWARRKRIPNHRRAAFFIHRNLHEKGLKPRPYLRMALAWARANTDRIAFATERRLKIR